MTKVFPSTLLNNISFHNNICTAISINVHFNLFIGLIQVSGVLDI